MTTKSTFLMLSAFFLGIVGLASCNNTPKHNSTADGGAHTGLTAAEAKDLAKDAFLFGAPLVFIELQFDYNTYSTKVAKTKAPVNQFVHYRAFVDASDRSVVGFNVDNLYSFAGIDLAKEPMVLSIPEMGNRFWLMQLIDGWNGVPAAPGSREEGGKGGNFAITGPGWKGQLPEGMKELKSPTNMVIIGGRTYCSGPSDYAAVHKLQDQYTLTPLSQWGKNYTPPANVPLKTGFTDTILVNKQFMALSAEQFYKNLNRLMVDNPPYASDADMMKKIDKLGIKPGADFALRSFDAEVAKAIEEGYAEGQKEMLEACNHLGKEVNGWSLTYDMGRYGTRYAYRAAWTFVGIGGNILEDAFYPVAQVDADGNKLDAANRYTLSFKKDEIPPANAFWSLTMYDADGYLVPNKLKRYALGDRSNLTFEKDGSLILYLQSSNPGKDKEHNWLPAPAQGVFKIALRLYGPKQQVIDKNWIPPAVQKVK